MGDRSFVFREADASALQDAFSSLAEGVRDEISDMRLLMSGKLSGWSAESQSRQAQMDFDVRLGERSEELAEALDKAAEAMGEVRDLARRAEIRNVAVLD